MTDLRGMRALVTGGAKRLGREIALTLAKAGADVAITFLESEKEAARTVRDLGATGARAHAVRCDVREEKSVKAAVKEAAGELGGLDVLVNNAGFYETVAFDKISARQWENIFAINTRGPYFVAREAAPYLKKSRG